MQIFSATKGFQVSELAAINLAKALTLLCLLSLSLVYGLQDMRQVLYICLHGSYCSWWLLEQWLFPQRRQQIFTAQVGLMSFLSVLLFVGLFYALPGYLAFANSTPIGYATVAIALLLYIFGSLINTSADVQKMTAKSLGAGLVSDGIWRSLRHVNYLGDLMRYSSFSALSGSYWSLLLPGTILLLYLQRIAKKEQAMAKKYDKFADYAESSTRLIPWLW